MKTLKTVQIIMKVLKVLTLIALVFCIIGTVIMAASSALLLILPADKVSSYLVNSDLSMTPAEVRFLSRIMVGMTVILIGTVVSCVLTNRYLKFELSEGTPFTFRGAKKLRNLGIAALVIPLAAGLIYFVITSVAGNAFLAEAGLYGMLTTTGSQLLSATNVSIDLTGGLALLFLSFIFKHGAEVRADAMSMQERELHAAETASEAPENAEI